MIKNNLEIFEKFEEELILAINLDNKFKKIEDFDGQETQILAISIYDEMSRWVSGRVELKEIIAKVLKGVYEKAGKEILEVINVLIIQAPPVSGDDLNVEYDLCFKVVK